MVYYDLIALAGNYVNFGVFELYGDRALADALDISLKMALSVPLTDILAYRKVCCCTFLIHRNVNLSPSIYLCTTLMKDLRLNLE